MVREAPCGARPFAAVPPPRPVLSSAEEARLTPRQRALLDALETLALGGGLGDETMAGIAARVNCSLRTLYGIARSRDALLLIVVDRHVRRAGRVAMATIDGAPSPLDALRRYLRAVNGAMRPMSDTFARTLARIPGLQRLIDEHEQYIAGITRGLLDRSVAARQIRRVDTAAVAHVLGGLGRDFLRPEVGAVLGASAEQSANDVTEIILRGLLPKGR